jgi:hypothetical protein
MRCAHRTVPPRARLSEGELLWHGLCAAWQLSTPIARKTRRIIEKSVHPDAVTLRYRLAAIVRLPTQQRLPALRALGKTAMTPAKLLALLENGISAKWATRGDIQQLEAAILHHVDKDGNWVWGPHRRRCGNRAPPADVHDGNPSGGQPHQPGTAPLVGHSHASSHRLRQPAVSRGERTLARLAAVSGALRLAGHHL